MRRAAPALALAAALLLAMLGAWQVQRLFWKRALIARVEARLAAPAVPLPPRAEWRVLARDGEYRRVVVSGRWLAVRPAFAKAVTVLGPGWWVIAPLATRDGVVLVNRGFVPEAERPNFRSLTSPQPRSLRAQSRSSSDREGVSTSLDTNGRGKVDTNGEVAGGGEVTITGLLRRDEPGGGFLRRNDAAHERWFSRDVQAIARARGLARVAPFFLDAARDPAVAWPRGGMTVVRFRDNHLVYALTWFALAALALWSAWRFGRREAA